MLLFSVTTVVAVSTVPQTVGSLLVKPRLGLFAADNTFYTRRGDEDKIKNCCSLHTARLK